MKTTGVYVTTSISQMLVTAHTASPEIKTELANESDIQSDFMKVMDLTADIPLSPEAAQATKATFPGAVVTDTALDNCDDSRELMKLVESVLIQFDIPKDQCWEELSLELKETHPALSVWLQSAADRWTEMGE